MSQTPKVPSTAEHTEDRAQTASEEAFRGTDKMPMPDASPKVAGRSRQGRTITEPGEPGVITPEDDVLDTAEKDPHRG